MSEFYSKGNRTDSACKDCQKEKKRAKRSLKPIGSAAKTQSPVQYSHISTLPPQYPHIEPESDSQYANKSVDFLHWEKRYGRPLTDLEKMEIKDNLTNLFKLLQSEECQKCQS